MGTKADHQPLLLRFQDEILEDFDSLTRLSSRDPARLRD
jgi:hypothetical protein